MAIITIFGLAGTGTSSCGKILAHKLNYEFVSTGNLFRQMAREKGMEFYEYDNFVIQNPSEDQRLDQKIIDMGKEKDNLVIDSRLAWHFIPHSIKVKFKCDDEVRFKRISSRDEVPADHAMKKTLAREATHTDRYKNVYGIEDYKSDNNFDLIIDTTDKSPNEVVDIIIKSYKLQP